MREAGATPAYVSLLGRADLSHSSFLKMDLPLPSHEDMERHLLMLYHTIVSETGSVSVLKWQGVETLGVRDRLSYCL
jgi:hypothetical protein